MNNEERELCFCDGVTFVLEKNGRRCAGRSPKEALQEYFRLFFKFGVPWVSPVADPNEIWTINSYRDLLPSDEEKRTVIAELREQLWRWGGKDCVNDAYEKARFISTCDYTLRDVLETLLTGFDPFIDYHYDEL